MQQWIAKKSETLFNVLFVMMEGLESEFREIAWRKTILLFIIDFFQLLRILTLPVFGWSERTSGLIEKFDVVYDVTLLGSMVVPRYSFFILAFVVVFCALAETAYVARIFEAGSVKQMWPVKVLRVIVVMLVTTLFSSLLKWLLIPLSCLVSDKDSFSQEIHGEGTSCDPFRFPELLATVPTIIVALLYIAFAFVVTTFSMQVNVISRAPRTTSTGRVEILFLTNKVAATCLVLLCGVVSPTAVATVLLIISVIVFWLHAQTLPFHHHPTNVLRGGIYGATSWAALSSTVVSLNDNLTLQWTLIALLPFVFLFGMLYVHWSRARLLSALDRLRGEWESSTRRKSAAERRASESAAGAAPAASEGDDRDSGDAPSQRKPPVTGVDRFYDTNGEKRRIFVSGRHALACARVLLYKRKAEDRAFLEYVIERGLEDFRDCQQLQVFRILVLSTVLERQRVAKAEEKHIKDNGETLPIDLRYLLFCFSRKTTQAMAAHNLGKQKGGQISAINLMEFNLGLTKAKQAHAKSIQAIKNCWRSVYRMSKGNYKQEKLRNLSNSNADAGHTKSPIGRSATGASTNHGMFDEVVAQLEEYMNLTREAKHEYSSLLFKYPTSVELLFSYSAFLDVCMNDAKESDARLAQAIQLQEGDGSDDDGNSGAEGGKSFLAEKKDGDGKSATSGSTASQDKRKVTQRFVTGWEHRIMGHDSKQLRTLIFRVKFATLLLVGTATVAFVVSDFVLFKGMTKAEMHRITSIGELYTTAVAVCFYTRSMLLTALTQPQELGAMQDKGQAYVADMQRKHVDLHAQVDFPEADEFFNIQHFTMLLPTAGGWKEDHSTLWEVGNEFTTRAALAYSTPLHELTNSSYELRSISDEKRNIPFVAENVFRVVVPTLEDLKVIYVHEMEVIQQTVDLLVSINASCNSFLAVVITILVLRGLWRVCHNMESKALMCELMASLPHRTAKRIYDFYRKAEYSLQELEDEDVERNGLLSIDGDADYGVGSPGGKVSPKGRTLPYHRAASRQAEPPWDDAERYDSLGGKREDEGRRQLRSRVNEKWVSGYGNLLEKSNSWAERQEVLDLPDDRPSPIPAHRSAAFAVRRPRSVSPDRFSFRSGGSAASKVDRGGAGEPAGDCGPVVLPLTAHNLEIQTRSFKKKQLKERELEIKGGKEGGSEEEGGGDERPVEVSLQAGLRQSEQVLVGRRGGRGGAAAEMEHIDVRGDLVCEEQEEGVEEAEAAEARAEREEVEGAGDGEEEGGSGGVFVGLEPRPRAEEVEVSKGSSSATKTTQRKGARGDGGEEEAEGREEEGEGAGEGGSSAGVGRMRSRDVEPMLSRVPGDASNASDVRESKSREREEEEEDDQDRESSSGRNKGPAWHSRSFKSSRNSGLFSSLNGHGMGKLLPGLLKHSTRKSPHHSPAPSKTIRDRIRKVSMSEAAEATGQERLPTVDLTAIASPLAEEGLSAEHAHDDRGAAVVEEVRAALRRRRPWYLRTNTWVGMFAVVLTLCLISTILATRDFSNLIELAPIVKEAGRRLMLVKAGAFFARELVLDDGFSRMTRQQLSDGLLYIVEELRHADRVLRLGDAAAGVKEGADVRNEYHNLVMYENNCPWTDQSWQDQHAIGAAHRRSLSEGGRRAGSGSVMGSHPSAGQICADPAKPSVGAGGLLSVLVAFENALETVLHRHGLPADEHRGELLMTYTEHVTEALAGTDELAPSYEVRVSESRRKLLESDQDVVYALTTSDGYLADGLRFVLELLDHELDAILHEAIRLNEILFALYLVTIVVAFWWLLFRRAMQHASGEAQSARALVRKMPLHVLSQVEIDGIAEFFQDSDDDEGGVEDASEAHDM